MTEKTKAELATDLATNFANNTSGAITPAVFRAFMTDVLDSLGWVYPNRVAWETAGGAVPSLALASTETGTAPVIGTTGKVILSKWNRSASEAVGTSRIHAGSNSTAGTAAKIIVITGLPNQCLVVGSGNEGGQPMAKGFLVDGGTGNIYAVLAVIDPAYDEDNPVMFYFAVPVATVDPTDLTSAAISGALSTSVPEVIETFNALVSTTFAGTSPVVQTTAPFTLDHTYYLNLDWAFECVVA